MGHWNFDDHLAGWNDHFTIRFLEKYRAIRKDILNADPCGDEIQSMVKAYQKVRGS